MRRFLVETIGAILLSSGSFGQISANPFTRLDREPLDDNKIPRNVFEDNSSWGVVSSGVIYVITPTGIKEPPGPGEGAGAMVSPFTFEIRSEPLSEVTVKLRLPTSFTSDDDNGSLPLTNWTYGFRSIDGDCFDCAGALRGDSVSVFIESRGAKILLIGATVSVPSEAFSGGYTAGIAVSYSGVSGNPSIDTTVVRTIDVESEPAYGSIDGEMKNLSRNRSYSLFPGTNSNPIVPVVNGGENGKIPRVVFEGNAGSEILVSTILPTSFTSDDELYPPGLPCTYSDSSFYVEETGEYINPLHPVKLIVGSGGYVTLEIGLVVTVPADAVPGSYTSQMILSATYTGNAKSAPRKPRQSEAEVLITAQVLDKDIPDQFSLLQNYPNPFNSGTTISYGMARGGIVELNVFDLLGREVTTVVRGFRYAGVNSERFDAGNLPSGLYYYRISAEGFSDVKKMVLVR